VTSPPVRFTHTHPTADPEVVTYCFEPLPGGGDYTCLRLCSAGRLRFTAAWHPRDRTWRLWDLQGNGLGALSDAGFCALTVGRELSPIVTEYGGACAGGPTG
jgi:hypothetical protein